jgi:chaperonin GroES
MKFRPLHDRILVSRTEEVTTTTGGIIIPDTAKEKPMEGIVLETGPGARDENSFRSMSSRATVSCLANGQAPK